MLTVTCVLKSGGDYTSEYVHILRDSVRRHWPEGVPFRFVCLTDLPQSAFLSDIETMPLASPFPGWWAKMELFSPRVSDALGDILYFDLDTAICGPLADVVTYCGTQWERLAGSPATAIPSPLTVLRDFYRPHGYGSGMMFIPKGTHEPWDKFNEGFGPSTYRAFINEFRGDQDFLEKYAPGAARWQDVCPGQIVSFKPAPIFIQGKPAMLASLPRGASVVAFHGFPRPAELPADHWVRQHWRRENLDEHLYGSDIGRTGTHDV